MVRLLKIGKIRKALLFTLFMMVIYMIGKNLLIPGISLISGDITISTLSTLYSLTGGSLENFSLFSLGIGPSITASLVIQLLSSEDTIPYLSSLTEDNKGRKKLQKITQFVAFVLAMLQSYSMIRLFDLQYGVLSDSSIMNYIFIMIVMTAGSMLLYWMGNLITEYGIGDGTSCIILFGILSSLPSTIVSAYNGLKGFTLNNTLNYGLFGVYILILLLIIYIITYLSTGVRKLQVSYSRKLRNGEKFTHLPIRVNSASVMPLIYANAVMTSPLIILSYFNKDLYLKLSEKLSTETPLGLGILVILMLLLGLFFTINSINPKKVAKDLSSNGGYIVGVRPNETEKYITEKVINTTLVGIIGLILLIAIPQILIWIFKIPSSISFGGTSFILVVSILANIISTLEINVKDSKYKEWF